MTCKVKLDEIKKLHSEAFEKSLSSKFTDKERFNYIIENFYYTGQIEWLIHQVEMFQRLSDEHDNVLNKIEQIEHEIENLDMATAVDNIIKIVKG